MKKLFFVGQMCLSFFHFNTLALECKPLTNTEENSLYPIFQSANDQLKEVITKRSLRIRGKDGHHLYAPNLDGTYFYRLGRGTLGYSDQYSLGEQIISQRDKVLEKNFPRFNQLEAMSLSFLNNESRAVAKPSFKRCAKHYPGGDERLELTEGMQVLFDNAYQFKLYHTPFKEILKTEHPPSCMMVGHAQYLPEFFELPEWQMIDFGFDIGEVEFSKVPASLNPYIVKNLKEKLNFKGMIIADWLNMVAVKDFVASLNSKIPSKMLILYLTLKAGNDFAPMLFQDNDYRLTALKGFLRELSQGIADGDLIMKEFSELLNKELNRATVKIFLEARARVSLRDIVSLGMFEKIKIVTLPIFSESQVNYEYFPFLREVQRERLKAFSAGTDTWNRTGVLTLMQRQLIIKELAKQKEIGIDSLEFLPSSVQEEEPWFNSLMGNSSFLNEYNQIDWDSDEVQNIFCHVTKSYIKK